MNPARLPVLIALLALAGCNAGPVLELPEPVHLDVPLTTDASLPHVADGDGHAILSWVERDDATSTLVFARWNGAEWNGPHPVARGTGWFVNWADFPSVVSLGGQRMAAHWLQRSGPGTYAYDVMVVRSEDGGATWSAPVRPHLDGTQTEHGFVSLFAHDGELNAVWLDGRQYADGEAGPATNEMSVRHARLGAGAAPIESVIAARACDCCQTSVAHTTAGPMVAYRGRTQDEVRDIEVAHLSSDGWTEPRRVHEDGWRIEACPVNGPQADAIDDVVSVAWFTAAQDTPRVRVAFAADGGTGFGPPLRVDDGDPLGRADVLLLDRDRALVLWLERTADGAEVRARVVARDGTMGPPRVIGLTSAQRPSGFPRMGRYEGGVLIAWTEPGSPSVVRAAVLDGVTR